jgi:hypothetical protein
LVGKEEARGLQRGRRAKIEEGHGGKAGTSWTKDKSSGGFGVGFCVVVCGGCSEGRQQRGSGRECMRHASNRVRAEFESRDVFFAWKMLLYSDSL